MRINAGFRKIYHLKPPLIDLNNSIQKQGTNIKIKCPFYAVC